MSVFTPVSPEVLQHWLQNYPVGELLTLEPILHGVQNSNYRVSTSVGVWILTLFEDLSFNQAHNYLCLMQRLWQQQLPVAEPLPSVQGQILGNLQGRPAALLHFCPGQMQMHPENAHLQALGVVLAQLHQAMQTWDTAPEHPKNLEWRLKAAEHLLRSSVVSAEDRHLLHWAQAIDWRQHVAKRHHHSSVIAIHADLFRDNVLWQGTALSAVLDFYGAGRDLRVFELAVVLNDWCRAANGVLDVDKARVFLQSYQRVQALTLQELQSLADFLVIAALRFFLSRSLAWQVQADSERVLRKDPQEYRTILWQLFTKEYNSLHFETLMVR